MRRHPITIVLVLCVAALLATALAGCSSGGTTSGTATGGASGGTTTSGTMITEENFAFNPATAAVKVGDVVTFVNNDSAPHQVSIDGKDLGQQEKGKSVTWTASKAGTFSFSCVIHPSMTGEITVK